MDWVDESGILIGALLCFVWCCIMRYVAGFMVWGSILALHVLLAGGIFFCWNEYTELEGIPGSTDDFSLTLSLDSYLRLQKTWLIAGIVFSVLLTIMLLLMLCLCNRIRIAINLIEEASKAVSAFWSTLFWPIIPFCMQLCVTVLWCAIAVYLATSKEKTFVVNSAENGTNVTFRNFEPCDVKTFDPQGTSTECMFNSYELPEYHNYMQFINVFCYLWVLNFIIGLNQVTLAGVFATYFWTVDKKDLPKFPLLRSLIWTITYHTGSVAFGALIIAIVQLIRIFLEYIELQLKGKKNKVAKFILRCLKCIFWCLEKFLKFINKNAYIMIAIYGKNFCTSAQNAFFLLMRNIIRVAVVNKITDFLLFIGIAMVTIGVVVLSFFYFTFSAEYSLTAFVVAEYLPIPNVRYYWVIIIMIGLGTFVVAQIFFGVFNMAVDTLFLSFLEDLERHDGSPERPYYMNKDLMQIVGKKNRKRHEQWLLFFFSSGF
ncbi:putative choline transporter-like protein 2 [Apostichopus japonicus]|uniref:Choline transporter-like protein n=1 Tax=Stichopus japonicus TaxID=307972 RepID=A0A2G8KIX8_STIJA|nr:putative choline transporter-like protein 2 [Apostichopus japonicus]